MEQELFPLDPQEARVLGCLIEKAMTTPDQYPMSLNGVRVACNQVSNRHPVVDYDETTVAQTLRRLADKGLAKFVHRPGDRVVKHIHAADQVLEMTKKEVALAAVLLLRGAQTPGELRQRTTRYAEFSGIPEIETTLEALRRRDPQLVEELPRQPGQKENRWLELMTGGPSATASDADTPVADPPTAPHADPAAVDPAAAASAAGPPAPGMTADPAAIEALREEIAELRVRFERLLDSLGVDDI